METNRTILFQEVVSLENKKSLGSVKDVLIDSKTKGVGFFLVSDDLQTRLDLLPWEGVIGIGDTYITILNERILINAIEKEGKVAIRRSCRLVGLEVFSRKGDAIGNIRSFIFNTETGVIETVYLDDGSSYSSDKIIFISPTFIFVEGPPSGSDQENVKELLVVDESAIESSVIIRRMAGSGDAVKDTGSGASGAATEVKAVENKAVKEEVKPIAEPKPAPVADKPAAAEDKPQPAPTEGPKHAAAPEEPKPAPVADKPAATEDKPVVAEEKPQAAASDGPKHAATPEDPKPTAAAEEPKPTAAAEEPKPAPVADKPPAAAEEPKPTAAPEEPKPTADKPATASEEPKPAPAPDEPKPTADKTAPAPDEPKPAESTDKPSDKPQTAAAEESKPAPTTEEPKPLAFADEPKPVEAADKPAATLDKPAAALDEPKPATIPAKLPMLTRDEPKPTTTFSTPFTTTSFDNFELIISAGKGVAETEESSEETPAPLFEHEALYINFEQTDKEENEDEALFDLLRGSALNDDVVSADGTFIARKGTVLTDELLLEAQKHDALVLLTISINV